MIGFIDPPGRYVPKTQWRRFLAHMQTLPQRDPQVQAAIRLAHEALARPDPLENLPPAARGKARRILDFWALKCNFKGRDDAALCKPRRRL